MHLFSKSYNTLLLILASFSVFCRRLFTADKMNDTSSITPQKLKDSNDTSRSELHSFYDSSHFSETSVIEGSNASASDSFTCGGFSQSGASVSNNTSLSKWSDSLCALRSNKSTSCETSRTNRSNQSYLHSFSTQGSVRESASLLEESNSTHGALNLDLAGSTSHSASQSFSRGSTFGASLPENSISELTNENPMLSFFSKSQDILGETESVDLAHFSRKKLVPPPPPLHADDNAVDYDISVLIDDEEENVGNECPISPDLFDDSEQNGASALSTGNQDLHLEITEDGEEASLTERIFAGDFSNG